MKTHLLYGILAVALAHSTWAGSRSSGTYSIPTEAVDSGGLRNSSAAYCSDGSLGGIGGVSSVPAADHMAKHNYIGQLYDVCGMALSSSALTIKEGTSRLVEAYASMDDSTVLKLPWRWVKWSIVDGPIAGISVTGLVSAGIVWQDTPGTVGGSAFGKSNTLTFNIWNINDDNYGIYAGDGLPDDWQVNHFGTNNASGLFTADPDLDGQNNGFEYMAGTDPTNSESRFRFSIAKVPGHEDQKNLIFSPIVAGREYQAVYRTNLVLGDYFTVYPFTSSDVGVERTVTDLAATNAMQFYRIVIMWAP